MHKAESSRTNQKKVMLKFRRTGGPCRCVFVCGSTQLWRWFLPYISTITSFCSTVKGCSSKLNMKSVLQKCCVVLDPSRTGFNSIPSTSASTGCWGGGRGLSLNIGKFWTERWVWGFFLFIWMLPRFFKNLKLSAALKSTVELSGIHQACEFGMKNSNSCHY